MTDEAKKPAPGDLAGDGLGDAAGQATGAEMNTGRVADMEAGVEEAAEAAEAATKAAGAADAELANAKEQIVELTDRLLRVQADYENYKRRVQKEKEDLAVYANQKLLLSLLPVLDNLDRALATAPSPGDEKLRQGVELTARSFRDILVREGVTPIDSVGKPFDPNLHEAVMTVESGDHPDGTVVMEFQRGYRLGDRIIRPSMVQVSKQA